MLNKRTQNSKTWMNFDGSFTTEIHSGLVHYEDENGNMQNINTDLYDEADFDIIDFPVAKDGDVLFHEVKSEVVEAKRKGSLNRDNFDFQGLKVPFDCHIPRNIRRGYSIGKGASKLKFTPVEASASKGYVEGNKVTYPDVWADTDLVLEILPTGIKETIILKTNKTPFDFSFEVEGELADELKIQPPWLKDAEGTVRNVVSGVNEVDGKVILSLAADVSGLVYPIEIDPTVVIQPDGTTGKDSYVDSLNSTINFGNDHEVYIGNYSSSRMFRSYFQFDVSGIPTDSTITSATFNLTYTGGERGSSIIIEARKVLSSWSDTTINWDNQPSFDITNSEINAIVENISLDVKNIVQSWLIDSNYGLVLKGKNESASINWKRYASSDNNTAANRPKLIVTYNIPPTAPKVIAPNGGETWNSEHTIVWQEAVDNKEINIGYDMMPSSNVQLDIDNNSIYQTFLARESGVLESISVNFQTIPNGSTVFVAIGKTTGSTGQTGTTLASKTVTSLTSGKQKISFSSDNVQLEAGQYYYVQFSFRNLSFYLHVVPDNTYADGTLFRLSHGVWIPFGFDLAMLIEFKNGKDLRYQIQLTSNDGTTWKDIVPLTPVGVTSYDYDFINEPESSLCKVRIRAYDGSAYGEWDESDGVFTILHNQAPSAPTNLSPNGITIDRGASQRFSWQFNDPNSGDMQSKFDLQWRMQGSTTWLFVSQDTINNFYDFVANNFPRGTIEWRVRTYDQEGLSGPYSDIATFFAGDKPSKPIIISPETHVSVANPTVQWSSVGQIGFLLTVKDGTETIFSRERNSTNKAETVTYSLANQEDYTIELRIRNADGLYSDPDVREISVSYTPPAIPNIETVKGNSYIQINITDQVPTGTQPNVLYHEIFKEINDEFVLIATNVDSQYRDYHVASSKVERYFVRTIGDNGTFSDTSIFTESVTFVGVWLHLVDDYSTIYQFKYDGDGRDSNWGLEHAYHKFQGRKLPVVETGDMEDYQVNFTLTILTEEERQALERIVYSGKTVCYRDGRGRKVFGVFVQAPLSDEISKTYSTKLTINKIDFKEDLE